MQYSITIQSIVLYYVCCKTRHLTKFTIVNKIIKFILVGFFFKKKSTYLPNWDLAIFPTHKLSGSPIPHVTLGSTLIKLIDSCNYYVFTYLKKYILGNQEKILTNLSTSYWVLHVHIYTIIDEYKLSQTKANILNRDEQRLV